MTSQALRCLATVASLAAFLAVGTTCAGAKVLTVRITDLIFEPPEVTVAPGDTIEWRNEDFVDHTATTRGDGFDITIPAGETRRFPLGKAGTHEYYCRFHPGMSGWITVK
jgi:plastocyanin